MNEEIVQGMEPKITEEDEGTQGFTVQPTGMMEQVREGESNSGVPMGKVSICRMVEYRSRTGSYSVPAVVNCTTESLYTLGVEAGFVPALSSPEHVHLTVFSPGLPGMRTTAGDTPGTDAFVVKSQYPVSENVSGSYQEWDIPYDSAGGPGTWCWPTRV